MRFVFLLESKKLDFDFNYNLLKQNKQCKFSKQYTKIKLEKNENVETNSAVHLFSVLIFLLIQKWDPTLLSLFSLSNQKIKVHRNITKDNEDGFARFVCFAYCIL